jgi:hypothetical protein
VRTGSLGLFLTLVLVGCGPSDVTDTAPTITLEPWEEVFADFGLLETVAGTGLIGTKGFDGWDEAFEGGPAVEAELSRPHMAQMDDAGVLYIADKDAQAIRRVDLDGTIHTIAGTGEAGDSGDGPAPADTMQLSSPNGLWVRGDGTYYILDLANEKIRKVTPDGTLTTFIDVPGLQLGRGLWISEAEDLAYIASGNVIYRWTSTNGVEVFASGFANLGNLAMSPDGWLAATDRSKHEVYRIADDGTVEVIAGNGTTEGGGDGKKAKKTGLEGVRGIWFHPDGGYFLACHEGGAVWYVDEEGMIHLFLDGDDEDAHRGDGKDFDQGDGEKVASVRAVWMDKDGNLLITENDAGFIRMVHRDAT